MNTVKPFGFPIGISITFWGIIGLIRFISEKYFTQKQAKSLLRYKASDIAVIIPSHNEELVIRRCIKALKLSLNPKQIYVVSDGSVDKTYRRAKMENCHVSYLTPGRGKAKALVYLLKRFRLFNRYKLIFIVDSDTQIDKDFVKYALRLFSDPEIGVVFGSVRIKWPNHIIPRLNLYFIAYRERLSRMLQYFLAYGQTWKYTNVNYVVPGFATIYKSEILKQLEIDTPGLLIEDFNLAFQIHRKKLCKVGFNPSMIGWDQHPDNLSDYWEQVRRWNIGFFQTVKKNGVWISWFWLTLGFFSLEVLANSLFILVLPIFLFFIILPFFSHLYPALFSLSSLYQTSLFGNITLQYIFIGVFLFDYLFTFVMGVVLKRPQFIIYGLFFIFLHYVTSLILIASIIPGFFGRSDGRWTSPKRHSIGESSV